MNHRIKIFLVGILLFLSFTLYTSCTKIYSKDNVIVKVEAIGIGLLKITISNNLTEDILICCSKLPEDRCEVPIKLEKKKIVLWQESPFSNYYRNNIAIYSFNSEIKAKERRVCYNMRSIAFPPGKYRVGIYYKKKEKSNQDSSFLAYSDEFDISY